MTPFLIFIIKLSMSTCPQSFDFQRIIFFEILIFYVQRYRNIHLNPNNVPTSCFLLTSLDLVLYYSLSLLKHKLTSTCKTKVDKIKVNLNSTYLMGFLLLYLNHKKYLRNNLFKILP